MKLLRLLLILLIVIALLAVVGYAAASYVVYSRLSNTVSGCSNPDDRDNTPRAFDSDTVDMTPYLMPDYQSLTLISRDDNLSIDAWYVPVPGVDKSPTVILVHGLASCKRSPAILMPAGMLHRAGYNVLMIDLRDHGDSQIEDGRYAAGSDEYLDVLGAWDWLVEDRGIAPEQIGLFGTSLGAATAMIAFGREPRVAAVWEDSGFADMQSAIDAELARNGFPTFLSSGAFLMGRLIANDDLIAFSPQDAAAAANGRPVYITHGTADTRLSVEYASWLSETLRASGQEPQVWIVEGSEHVQAMFDQTEEYERRLLEFFESTLAPA
jgi:fermentation-respiration switch protein FrsA (DUF1100 family)